MSLLPIDSIDIGERYRRDMGDLSGLAASIDRVGLLHPVVVMGDPEDERRWRLVAGERRLRACRDILHWERIHVRIVNGIDLLQAEHDENAVREPFTPSEAVAIAAALRPAIEIAATEREQAGTPSSQMDKGRTDEKLAAAVGLSRNTLRRAEAVVGAATDNPALAPIVEAMDDTGNVAGSLAAVQALPPDPAPEQVQAAAAAVRERRKPVDLPVTDAHRAMFPRMAAAELTADLHTAMGHVRIEKCPPSAWADRIERMRPEDIEDMRAKVARVRRWADEWDALLTPRPLSVVGGSK